MPLDASLNSDDFQAPELQFDESPEKDSKDEQHSGVLEAVGALSTCSNDQSTTSKTVVHMVSEFVIELLQALEVPESQIDELVARLEFCKPLDSDCDGEFSDNLVMVQLCEIANRIIANRDESEIKLEHSAQSVRL